jgi:hypothetical protein
MRRSIAALLLVLVVPAALGAEQSRKPALLVDLQFVPQGSVATQSGSVALPASLIDRSGNGKARSAADCAEVLSDALKEAFIKTLADQKLQSSWMSGETSRSVEGSPDAGAAAASGGTIEDRLKKLDDLLQKGLITETEHRAARAEILKDL